MNDDTKKIAQEAVEQWSMRSRNWHGIDMTHYQEQTLQTIIESAIERATKMLQGEIVELKAARKLAAESPRIEERGKPATASETIDWDGRCLRCHELPHFCKCKSDSASTGDCWGQHDCPSCGKVAETPSGGQEQWTVMHKDGETWLNKTLQSGEVMQVLAAFNDPTKDAFHTFKILEEEHNATLQPNEELHQRWYKEGFTDCQKSQPRGKDK